MPYPLLRAIEQNDLNAFRGLVNDPANVNSTNPDFNETALHLAMAVGNEEMVRELLVRETNIFGTATLVIYHALVFFRILIFFFIFFLR